MSEESSVGALRNRLESVVEDARGREGRSRVLYCLDCDEFWLDSLEPDECWENRHDTLVDDYEEPYITAWLGCLEYLKTEGYVDE